LLAVLVVPGCARGARTTRGPVRPLYVYNFGRLTEQTPSNQVALIRDLGYAGFVISAEGSRAAMLDGYLQAVGDSEGETRIVSVFVRYNFKDEAEDRQRWLTVLDQITGRGIDLWFIFGRPVEGVTDAEVERVLGEVADAALERDVDVVLYPHSTCYIESAEEALPFVRRLDRPNLGLAVHLYHELRAGNGARIEEVVTRTSPYLKAVTLAGADSVVDRTSPRAMNKSTIKPLDQGDYDLRPLIRALDAVGYEGPVGLMNFKIEAEPSDYLARSIEAWRRISVAPEDSARASENSQ
jgi:sugar phosphate isomerase/epimerase